MTLDTNILIAYLNGEPAIVRTLSLWKQAGRNLIISCVSLAEVLAMPGLTAEEEEKILGFLGNFASVPLDNQLARTSALFSRVYRLKLPDAAIAATAFERRVPLVSRDRILRGVREIRLVEL